ncbi:hypothetical protein B0173_02472 [Mycobacterium avium subsp. paratuberculosis]|nr:hypothetical protein B0173_02472 [Mycobacterium avium subsp. paratuberculosis]
MLLAAAVLMGPGPSLTRRRAGTPARAGGAKA